MPFIIGGAILAGTLASGVIGASSADKAAKAQQQAAARAQQLEQKRFEETRADLAPYRDVGAPAINTYADILGINGPERRTAAMANFQTDPGYQFAMDEGIKATSGARAAGGGYLAGGTLKALTRFGQGQANQQYGSYLDRFLNAASLGQNAAAQTGNFGAASAAREGGYITDAGAAKAGGYLAQGQAYTGAIDNALKLGTYGKGKGWF